MTAQPQHTITIVSIHTQRPTGWAAVSGRIQQSDAHPAGSVLELRGVWPGLHAGASYTLTLRHVPHPRFGDQYQVADVTPAAPSGHDTLVVYLQTFDGIGEKRAEAIYAPLAILSTLCSTGPMRPRCCGKVSRCRR